MQYKGRPKSRNIQDRRKAPQIKSMSINHIIRASEEEREGKAKGGSKGSRKYGGFKTGGSY